MSRLLYAHNITLNEFAALDYEALYGDRRRDSNFAAGVEIGDQVQAFRDHLGIAPLYFRFTDYGVKFSNQLSNLCSADRHLEPRWSPCAGQAWHTSASCRFLMKFTLSRPPQSSRLILVAEVTSQFILIR